MDIDIILNSIWRFKKYSLVLLFIYIHATPYSGVDRIWVLGTEFYSV